MNNPAQSDIGKTTHSISARSDRFLRVIITVLVLAFPAVVLFVNHGDSYTLGLLLLIGVWVWLRDGAWVWLTRDSSYLCLVFVLLFAVAVLAYIAGLQTESGFHFLGRYLRFLLIVPVYLAFRRYPPTAKTVFVGLALGALTAGILASLQFMHAHGSIRVAAQTDLSIIFGDLTTTMVLCMAAGFGLMAASRRHWSVPLLILCLAGGVAATLLSGTRGAWLPLFLLIPALATPAAGFLKRRYVFAIMLVLVAAFSSFYFVARSDTQERIAIVGTNMRNYFTGLKTAKARFAGEGTNLHCDSNKAFLNAWLRESFLAVNLKQDASVVADRKLDDMRVCTHSFAIRLHNRGELSVSGAAFPRIVDDGAGPQKTELLLRGKGAVSFAGTGQKTVNFDSAAYSRIALYSGNSTGDAIVVYVQPHESVWLVPTDGFFGEYSMSLAKTSVGQRFELWRAAWRLFLEHPLIGVGTGAYQAKTNQLIRQTKVAPFIGIYDHPHNDYLDALSSRGLLGFVALLAILLIPLWRFLRATRSPAHASHAIGLAGVLMVAGFAIYAMTDTIFLHSIMITWYVIYMALFYALLDTQAASQTNLKPAE